VGLLARKGRIDEAVQAYRPTFEYYDCGDRLDRAMDLLVEDGWPEQALALLDERSSDYVEEHSHSVRSSRLMLLANLGRRQKAITETAAVPPEEYNRGVSPHRCSKRPAVWTSPSLYPRSSAASDGQLALAEFLIR
jgi:hypothetical protein